MFKYEICGDELKMTLHQEISISLDNHSLDEVDFSASMLVVQLRKNVEAEEEKAFSNLIKEYYKFDIGGAND